MIATKRRKKNRRRLIMSSNSTVNEIPVLLQVKVIEDKGEETVFLDVYKTRTLRLNIDELLSKSRELEQAGNPDEGINLQLLDRCEQCKGELSLLIDEARTSPDEGIIFCTANIYCEVCSPSPSSPAYIISAVYDEEGSPVDCECLKCEDCREPAVIWLEGAVLCWPCIKKHNLKKSIMFDDTE
jgi:hypothetical protein